MPPDSADSGKGAGRASGSRGEIYVEYKQVGQAMKVTAVDAATGTEVVIMGPATTAQTELQKVAIRKLQMQLKKAEARPAVETNPEPESDTDTDKTPPSKGWIA